MRIGGKHLGASMTSAAAILIGKKNPREPSAQFLRDLKRQRAESIEMLDEELGGVERQMPTVTINPTEGLERKELRQRIDKALGQLSEAHRTVLILHEFEDLEYKEIAKRMKCSIGTVMSRLFYARRKMAVLLAGFKREELDQ